MKLILLISFIVGAQAFFPNKPFGPFPLPEFKTLETDQDGVPSKILITFTNGNTRTLTMNNESWESLETSNLFTQVENSIKQK